LKNIFIRRIQNSIEVIVDNHGFLVPT